MIQAVLKRTPITFTPFILGIMASLLLSFWVPYHHGILNPDAVCYLLAAKAMTQHGLQAGMQVCSQAQWPFYSWLIHVGVTYIPISYAMMAYIIDAVCSCITVFMFLAIVASLGGRLRVVWLALATILLAHEFNSVRAYIVRDHGFFAAYLTSIWFLLRYVKTNNVKYALGFGISLLLAFLFRIEAFLFLILLPFILLFNSNQNYINRIRSFFQLNLVVLFGVLAFISLFFIFPNMIQPKLGRLLEIPFQLQHGATLIINRLVDMKLGLANYVLTSDSAKQASLILMILLPTWYLLSLVSNLSLLYFIFIIYTLQKNVMPWVKSERFVIFSYVFVNIILTFLFLLQRSFLSKRYLIALSLTLMLLVPFGLDEFLKQAQAKKRHFAMVILILALIASAWTGIFSFRYSKQYIKDAGQWVAEVASPEDKIYVNNLQVAYYVNPWNFNLFRQSAEERLPKALAKGQWQQYQYIVLKIDSKQAAAWHDIIREFNQPVTKSFSNSRGDQILIYRIG